MTGEVFFHKTCSVLTRPVTKLPLLRYGAYFVVLVALGGTLYIHSSIKAAESTRLRNERLQTEDLEKHGDSLKEYRKLASALKDYEGKGIDVSSYRTSAPAILSLISQGTYAKATSQIDTILQELEVKLAAKQETDRLAAEEEKRRAEEAERNKGTLEGKVAVGGSALKDCSISLIQNNAVISTVTTDSAGAFSFVAAAGTYTIKASKKGYVNVEQKDVQIQPQQKTVLSLTLPVVTVAPKPSPASSPSATTSTKYSSLYTQKFATDRGTYSATIMAFEMGPGKVKAIVDTASDGDCANNCPVLPVDQYVKRHNGIAGINGTYFCPTAYPDCAGKTNSFYWKLFNPRLDTMINKNNFLGEKDPFVMFNSAGSFKYLSTWDSYSTSGFPLYSGFSCKPGLIENKAIVLDEDTLDDKQRTGKLPRAAIGFKGTTMYVVHVSGANVGDLAAVMKAMEVDNAINIDAGGSTGMYYNGSYKLGPGRSVPNAIVFVEQ